MVDVKVDDLNSFLAFLRNGYHVPESDDACEFGDHWYCLCGWAGYSYGEFIEHVISMWKPDA